jgi:predicted membrane protein
MFSGGKPYVVMPIVFGGAVTVSALVSVWKESEHAAVNPMLWVGVVGIVVCATIVAYFTPHAAPPTGKPGAAMSAAVQPPNS